MAEPVPVNEANTRFFLALLKKLSEDDSTGNIFFSPFSISAALAMVLLGAAGNTAAQMSEVLGFRSKETASSETEPMSTDSSTSPPLFQSQRQMQIQRPAKLPKYLQSLKNSEQDELHAKFAQLLEDFYKADAPYDLNLANRLYGEQSYEFVKLFLEETKKFYSAELETVDFKSGAEGARLNINSWVEQQTQGKVKDLLAQGVVSDMTRLVLVNAIYFKGKWAEQFKEEYTVDDRFRINKTETKPVKMMRQKKKFHINTLPEVNSQIIELPYVGEDLSMFIILPNDIEDETTGLKKLEQELTFDKFEEWSNLDAMGKNEVELSLPRFKLEESYSLKEVLSSMGMVDAFDVSKSNFSGMSPANDLVLSSVVHKAFVEVNEVGTEAAAATAAVVGTRSVVIPDRFVADHPFLFFIQHKPTKTVLFAGRYSSPE
ncbi:leukocyte elastase inhibitor-like isoform X4 [Salarias fasciatus]|uniref:Serpin B6 n=1 Tax=Salarias fasciatus TaxID=181472 RepID=A0A672F4X8_SALFA|nr:leukocyte elastase inhibitor-like isoform X4 [Salarias fasciatus]